MGTGWPSCAVTMVVRSESRRIAISFLSLGNLPVLSLACPCIADIDTILPVFEPQKRNFCHRESDFRPKPRITHKELEPGHRRALRSLVVVFLFVAFKDSYDLSENAFFLL